MKKDAYGRLRRLRVGGAVLRLPGGVGLHPFRRTLEPPLRIALGTLEPISQNVEAASVPTGSGGIGHELPSWVDVPEYARHPPPT
jgi:hypothetical protein